MSTPRCPGGPLRFERQRGGAEEEEHIIATLSGGRLRLERDWVYGRPPAGARTMPSPRRWSSLAMPP